LEDDRRQRARTPHRGLRVNKIHLPVDLAANIEGNRVDLPLKDFPIEAPLFHDLGISNRFSIFPLLSNEAGTIVLNGPAGVFEITDFRARNSGNAQRLRRISGLRRHGWGHTATLVSKRGLANRMGHVSTGGGACLDYIAGRPLPGVVSLEQSAVAFGIDITTTDLNV